MNNPFRFRPMNAPELLLALLTMMSGPAWHARQWIATSGFAVLSSTPTCRCGVAISTTTKTQAARRDRGRDKQRPPNIQRTRAGPSLFVDRIINRVSRPPLLISSRKISDKPVLPDDV